MLLTLKAAEERQDELLASADVIVQAAKSANRDLTEDESKELDQIHDELKTVTDRRDTLKAREDLQAQILASRVRNGEVEVPPGDPNASPKTKLVIPASAKNYGRLKAYKGPDAERDAYIAGNFVLGALLGNRKAESRCKELGIWNTLTEGADGLKGGFLVPSEMQQTLVRLREERGVFTQYARSIPMGSDVISVPRDLTDTTAYWVGEGVEITAGDPEVGLAELTARKLGCLTKVSTELDEDAIIDIGDWVTRSMAYAMADKVDEAGFNGDGTSTYGQVLGLKNALNSSAIQDAASGNTGASTLDLTDFEATIGKLPAYPGMTPVWFMHSAVYWASAARLMDAAGGNRVQDLGSGPVMQFLGYPVVFTQVLPSTTGASTSTILAYFGDLSLAATVGNRRNVRTQVSVDRYFENDLIGIKATERLAINVHERGDTIRNRPIVALKTAAS